MRQLACTLTIAVFTTGACASETDEACEGRCDDASSIGFPELQLKAAVVGQQFTAQRPKEFEGRVKAGHTLKLAMWDKVDSLDEIDPGGILDCLFVLGGDDLVSFGPDVYVQDCHQNTTSQVYGRLSGAIDDGKTEVLQYYEFALGTLVATPITEAEWAVRDPVFYELSTLGEQEN